MILRLPGLTQAGQEADVLFLVKETDFRDLFLKE
jgi:hypothetical protein